MTCSSCLHWHANEIPRGAPVILDDPERVGECRAVPPQLVTVPDRGRLGFLAMYPSLKAQTPACGMRKAILEN